jgi:hypothetical protein
VLELVAGFFIAASCVRLYRDKKVRGVSVVHMAFYTVWGFWNLYFYPVIGAWLSFYGGIGVVITNTVWLFMMLYYMRKEKHG